MSYAVLVPGCPDLIQAGQPHRDIAGMSANGAIPLSSVISGANYQPSYNDPTPNSGTKSINAIDLVKKISPITPILYRYLLEQKRLDADGKPCYIHVCKNARDLDSDVMTWILEDVRIAFMQTSATDEPTQRESLSLDTGRIIWQYSAFQEGNPDTLSTVKTGWDRVNNRGI